MTIRAKRALVVDDEMDVRYLVSRSLQQEGFTCEQAVNGVEAAQMLEAGGYDLLVTDLRMPERNGHALVCGVLDNQDRPSLVVLTSCIEPRLVKDLMVRGVDDVVFKPIDFRAFAAKLSAIVQRRENQSSRKPNANCTSLDSVNTSSSLSEIPVVDRSEYEQRLDHATELIPLSSSALDVFNLADSGEENADLMSTLVLRDGVLTAELLRLANSAHYNPTGNMVVNVSDAILRVGSRRVGALALATSARGSLTKYVLPWLNADLVWRRSMAAVIAAAHLEDQGELQALGQGPFLGALLHPLGRVALGVQFPHVYEQLIKLVSESSNPLRYLERLAFPESHSAALVKVLAGWNLPFEILDALQNVADRFDEVQQLPEPKRMEVELVKVAVTLGRLAVGQWEPWDLVEFPSNPTLDRMGIRDLDGILKSTREDLRRMVGGASTTDGAVATQSGSTAQSDSSRRIRYCNLSDTRLDFIRYLLAGMGYDIEDVPLGTLSLGNDVVVNCCGTRVSPCISRLMANADCSRRLVIMDDSNLATLVSKHVGPVVALPASYAALTTAIRGVICKSAHARPSKPLPRAAQTSISPHEVVA